MDIDSNRAHDNLFFGKVFGGIERERDVWGYRSVTSVEYLICFSRGKCDICCICVCYISGVFNKAVFILVDSFRQE